MALASGTLLALARTDIVTSETHKFRGMATLCLVVLNNTHWSATPVSHKQLREELLTFAVSVGIEGPTWQAYAKGMDVMSAKFAQHFARTDVNVGTVDAPKMVAFDDIRDGSEVDAVAAITALFINNGVSSGGQIRDWAKQDGFAPFDAEKVKAQRKADAAAKKAEKGKDGLARLLGHVGTDSASIAATVAQDAANKMDAIRALLAGLSSAERLAIQGSLSTMLEDDVKAADAALATIAGVDAVEPPTLPDHIEDEVTTPNKARRARAVRLANAA